MMKLFAISRRVPIRHGQKSIHSGSSNFQKPFGPGEVQRSQLQNGIRIAAAQPLGTQMGACTVMFQAGSRMERDDQLGATHFIRAMSGSTGCAYSGYNKMRMLHQRGCYLTCSSDRQSVAFTLRCSMDDFSEMKYYLLDTATRCRFLEWEVTDIKGFVKDNLVRMHPVQRVLDLLQKAFWAGPLSNSIFCDEVRIDSMTSDYLKKFVMNFSPSNCTVSSYGLPFEEVMKLAEALSKEFTDSQDCAQEQTCSFPRGGSEYHELGRGSDTWLAMAVPGAAACDMCSMYKHALVARACDVTYAQVARQAPERGAQAQLCSIADELFTEYRAFNISYAETGMFGVLAKSRACNAEKAARAVVAFLSNLGKLNAAHIDSAKKRLKLDLTVHEEDCVRVSEGLALQIANNLVIDGPMQSFSIIDSITNEDVLKTAKEISSKQPQMAMAVVGDIAVVPSDVDLKNVNYGKKNK